MDKHWRIELFGGVRLVGANRTLRRFRAQNVAALLAYLALHLDRANPRDELIELVWPETDLDAGRASLRTALYSLRRQLEPPGVEPGAVLQAGRHAITLSSTAVTTDVAEFEAAARAVLDEGTPDPADCMERAVRLYADGLLPGYYQDWVGPEQERLADLLFQALGRVAPHAETRGELERALRWARRAVAVHPLREEGTQALMALLAR